MITGSAQGCIEGSPQNGYPKFHDVRVFRVPPHFHWRTICFTGGRRLEIRDERVVAVAGWVELVGDQPIGAETVDIPPVYGRPIREDRSADIAMLRQLGFEEIAT